MDRFDYRLVTINVPTHRAADTADSAEVAEALEALNGLGAQGWDAVGFAPATASGRGFHVETTAYVVLLKRRVR